MNLNNTFIIDAKSGTILPAGDCYLLRGDEFPDNDSFFVMSDDEMSAYAAAHGLPLTELS